MEKLFLRHSSFMFETEILSVLFFHMPCFCNESKNIFTQWMTGHVQTVPPLKHLHLIYSSAPFRSCFPMTNIISHWECTRLLDTGNNLLLAIWWFILLHQKRIIVYVQIRKYLTITPIGEPSQHGCHNIRNKELYIQKVLCCRITFLFHWNFITSFSMTMPLCTKEIALRSLDWKRSNFLTSTQLNAFWMNWNVDFTPNLLAQHQCLSPLILRPIGQKSRQPHTCLYIIQYE